MNSGPGFPPNNDPSPFADARVLLYHKQATSARTLFLLHAHGSVIAPEGLPAQATVLEEDDGAGGEAALVPHPAALHQDLGRRLQLDPGLFELDADFRAAVDVPGGTLAVYLAHFTTIDPPRVVMAQRGAGFHALTELRGRPPAEMELLRRAYAAILGG